MSHRNAVIWTAIIWLVVALIVIGVVLWPEIAGGILIITLFVALSIVFSICIYTTLRI